MMTETYEKPKMKFVSLRNEEAVANKTYDNLTTRTEIRDKVSKYLFKQTAKRPMVLPVILEINTSNLG